jgi:hemerythrin
MEEFIWAQKYETGSSAIDKQHKELFSKIDELSLALYNGTAKRIVEGMISFLERYIEDHFKTEEGIMRMAGYPHLSSHTQIHKGFNKIFESFKLDFQKRGADNYLAIHLEKEIRRWWEEHVLNEDMRYVPYLERLK